MKTRRPKRAFTLVELLITISVIAIMASLVITAFSNVAVDSRNILSRQQQAVVQEALNNWISKMVSGTTGLAHARGAYNAATTGLDKFALLQTYLDDQTYEHFIENTSAAKPNELMSDAMAKTGHYLQLTGWVQGSYPKVNLLP